MFFVLVINMMHAVIFEAYDTVKLQFILLVKTYKYVVLKCVLLFDFALSKQTQIHTHSRTHARTHTHTHTHTHIHTHN